VMGGFASGYMAVGGCALGWEAAQGGLAIAHELAQGGLALGAHANDSVAKAYFAHPALLFNKQLFDTVMILCWLPLLLPIWQYFRSRQRRRDAC
jgi:hypothetical protein